MFNQKSILSLFFALIATVLVSCSGADENTPPPTYSSEQIEQIDRSAAPVRQARERITQLETYINQGNWSDADSLLHGPLGGLRREMSYVTRKLLPKDQKQAQNYAKELFQDIERVDAAIQDEVSSRALENYSRAVNDLDNYLGLLPDRSAS